MRYWNNASKAGVAGIVAGICLMYLLQLACYDRQVDRLRRQVDSIAVTAQVDAEHLLAVTDSMKLATRALAMIKAPILVRVSADSALAALAASALTVAVTAGDSIAALVPQVRALRSENAGLRRAAAIDAAIILTERARGDSLERGLRTVTGTIVGLNARVQALGRRPPRWVRVSFELAKLGGAVYAGYQIGRHNP